jgi:hypothetical protein
MHHPRKIHPPPPPILFSTVLVIQNSSTFLYSVFVHGTVNAGLYIQNFRRHFFHDIYAFFKIAESKRPLLNRKHFFRRDVLLCTRQKWATQISLQRKTCHLTVGRIAFHFVACVYASLVGQLKIKLQHFFRSQSLF